MATRRPAGELAVVPADEAAWEDLQAVLGQRGDAAHCQCQWFKVRRAEWRAQSADERAAALREQTGSGQRPAASTSGLVAYEDGVPVGWCAVEPRTAYPRLLGMRVPWTARDEDRDDERVWAVTCFVTRRGYRRRGVSYALARATVEHAREGGARAVEGYPMLTQPGVELTWGELFVGSRQVFEEAGFVEVSRPTARRAVMRIEL